MNKEFDKIIGYQSIKNKLFKILDILNNKEKYEALGVKQKKAILLHGDVGVGKTLFANCFLNSCNRNTIVVRKDRSGDSFVDYINQSFENAINQSPSIILLDDLDKFANDDDNHRNSEEYITVQSCIDKVKDKDVFVFATANYLYNFPNSLLRAGRLGDKIKVQNPCSKDAKEIIKYYLQNKKIANDVDVEEIANILDGRSCAELEDIINEAGINAGYENCDMINQRHIQNAMLYVLFEAPENLTDQQIDNVETTSYHEAGHAVVAEVLSPKSVNIITVKTHDSNIGGLISTKIPKNYWRDIALMENKIKVLLGGKAAVELKYGKTDVGASNDLTRAFAILNRFFEAYAFGGLNNFRQGRDYSEKYSCEIEQKSADYMEHLYTQTKELLCQNIKMLDNFAKALTQNQTLFSKEIQHVKEQSY